MKNIHLDYLNPECYTQYDLQCIEITERMDFCLGNAVKHLWRSAWAGKQKRDLQCAIWYIDRYIKSEVISVEYTYAMVNANYKLMDRLESQIPLMRKSMGRMAEMIGRIVYVAFQSSRYIEELRAIINVIELEILTLHENERTKSKGDVCD